MTKKKNKYYAHKKQDHNNLDHLKIANKQTPPKISSSIKKYTITLLIIAVIVYLFVFFSESAEKNNAFAQCLTESNATMYAASWCSACNQQKAVLGNSKNIPYVECAQPNNPNAQTQECIDAGIEGYPTWRFADNTSFTGVLTKAELTQRTGCFVE